MKGSNGKNRIAALIFGVIVSVLSAAALMSCGAAREAFSGFGGTRESAKMESRAMADEDFGGAAAPEAPMELMNEEQIEMSGEAEPAPASGADDTVSAALPKEDERKRVYSGYAELLVDNVEGVKREISDIAASSGGYVENILENTITIRVPAEQFSRLFSRIHALGDLLDSYEETVDVTDFYSDLEARLRIAEETRDRLYALLERTEDVEERIKILQEIRRLSEEIERINLTFEVLKEHISFSRITVRLVSRLDYEVERDDVIPFSWIDNLHPLYPVSDRFEGSVKGEIPEMFALFEKDKYFRAETAEGIRFRISTVENSPKGDGAFWQEALGYHLSPRFAETSAEQYGDIYGVLLTSKDPKPYYYFTGVKPDRGKLHVVEVFIPDKGLLEDHYKTVVDALKEIEIR